MENQSEIKLYNSPKKAIQMMLLCSIFVAIGIFILVTEEGKSWIGWLNILFFGSSYPIGIYLLLDKKPSIVINEKGILAHKTHSEIIPWEVIQDAYISSINTEKFISLVVDKEYNPYQNKGKLYKAFVAANKTLGFAKLNIHIGQIAINAVKLAGLIIALSKLSSEQRIHLISDTNTKDLA